MDAPGTIIPAPAPEREGSTMRRFLGERGVIVMRENRPFASVTITYGAPLDVSSQIFVIIKQKQRQVSIGVHVTIGFYQTGRKQQAFARLGAASQLMFFPVASLEEIRRAVMAANEHSVARRASWRVGSALSATTAAKVK